MLINLFFSLFSICVTVCIAFVIFLVSYLNRILWLSTKLYPVDNYKSTRKLERQQSEWTNSQFAKALGESE